MNTEFRTEKMLETIEQRKILRKKLYRKGYNNSQLARYLGISPSSVTSFFNGTMNSQKIENAIHRLLDSSGQKATG